MAGEKIDGNNIIEVYTTIDKYARKMRRKPAPVLIEAMTFRMRGHEEASGVKYVPPELIASWDKKDPVRNYEAYLLKEGILTNEAITSLRKENEKLIQDHLDITFNEPEPGSIFLSGN